MSGSQSIKKFKKNWLSRLSYYADRSQMDSDLDILFDPKHGNTVKRLLETVDKGISIEIKRVL